MINAEIKRGFGSDNHAPVHPTILAAIQSVNHGHAHAYGHDETSLLAKRKIAEILGKNPQVYFLFNGTATNVLALRNFLESFQAVITTDCAHLNVDECGAPESHGGHKLLTVPHVNGKINLEKVKALLVRKGDQHAVQPKMISITQPTELGTVYSIEELKKIKAFCSENQLFLHMDGARLANAAIHLGVSLSAITSEIGIDALSFGGTKNGMMGAEALVLWNQTSDRFKYIQKQEMQLASKVRYHAAQFLAYLENDLWRDIAAESCSLASKLAERVQKFKSVEVLYPIQSNAVFARIPKNWVKPLKEACFFYVWDETEWVCRWMLSFDNKIDDIERFLKTLESLERSAQ